MAGKSGRTISNTPQNSLKSALLSWEGMLVVLFIAVNIFCMILSPNYQLKNVLREMPKYLAEVFIMFPMVFILVMGDIDILGDITTRIPLWGDSVRISGEGYFKNEERLL